MSKRGIPEINAGSMADIAFLLLIFFMVVTTLEEEMGISTNLPPANVEAPPIVVKERNVLIVKVNKFNQILVNNNTYIPADSIETLYDRVRDFYDHPDADESLPFLTKRNVSGLKKAIAKYKNYIAQDSDRVDFADSLQVYERKLLAVQLYGDYRELPDNAVISLQNDLGTNYETYIRVRDIMQRAINDMRNELTEPVFKMNWDALKNASVDKKESRAQEYADAYKALQQVVPMRIAEKSPNDTGK